MSIFQYIRQKCTFWPDRNALKYIKQTKMVTKLLNNLDRQNVGNEIKKARKSKNLSQFQLAELTGIDEKQIYRIESGFTSPKLENFVKIASVLDLNIKFFNTIDIEERPYVKDIINLLNESTEDKLKVYYNVLKSLNEVL